MCIHDDLFEAAREILSPYSIDAFLRKAVKESRNTEAAVTRAIEAAKIHYENPALESEYPRFVWWLTVTINEYF